MKYRLVITVEKVKGKCPVYAPGDRMIVEMPRLVLEETTSLCIHAFTAMQTILQALARGYSAKALGVGPSDDEAYVQCPDPGPPYTNGGTVIFKVKRYPVVDVRE